jgi:hypothetical protein
MVLLASEIERIELSNGRITSISCLSMPLSPSNHLPSLLSYYYLGLALSAFMFPLARLSWRLSNGSSPLISPQCQHPLLRSTAEKDACNLFLCNTDTGAAHAKLNRTRLEGDVRIHGHKSGDRVFFSEVGLPGQGGNIMIRVRRWSGRSGAG